MAARKISTKGRKPDKLMRDAIILALHREAEDADGQKTKKLTMIATKLVAMAANGDMQAIKEINDRVDGKSMQGLELSGLDGEPIEQVTVVELVAAEGNESEDSSTP